MIIVLNAALVLVSAREMQYLYFKEVFVVPNKDGTGPLGQGLGLGRGMGMGCGRGRRGSAGPGGNCVCPGCGIKVAHQAGTPCSSMNCPKCGMRMVRE